MKPFASLLVVIFANVVISATPESKKDDWHEKYPTGYKAEGALVKDESDRPYYADFWGERVTKQRPPNIAITLADKFYDAIPYEQRTPHRDKVRYHFIECFFEGFKNPHGSMTGGEVGGVEGFKAGQEHRRAHPDQIGAMMKAFGYEQIEVEGVWTSSFEHSGFKPKDKDSEQWWMGSAGYTESDLPKGFKIPDGGVIVLVVGYVSGEGRYGHLGSYKREILAQKITRKKEANKSPN